MYSFGNQGEFGELSMQPIGGDEMGCGFGDEDIDDSSITDATYDVDGVMGQMQLAVDTDPYAIGQNLGLMDDGGMTDLEDSTELDDAEEQDGGLGGYTGGLMAPAQPPPQGYYVPAPPAALPSPSTAGLQRLGHLHLGIAPAPSPTPSPGMLGRLFPGFHLGIRRHAPPAPPPPRSSGLGHLHIGVRRPAPPAQRPVPQHPAAPQPHPSQVSALGFNVSAGGSGGFSF